MFQSSLGNSRCSFKRFSRTAAIAIALLGMLGASQAQADNGVSTEDGLSGGQDRGPITPGGLWYDFFFGAVGSFAEQGNICSGSTGANSTPADNPPYTFTAGASGALVSVVDGFVPDDRFEVFDFGLSLGQTSAPSGSGDCSDPEVCKNDVNFSRGFFTVGPGAHSITIQVTEGGSGCSWLRADDIDVCGDDILTGAEECDDGNTANGDCCSSTCEFEEAESPCNNGDMCTGDVCDDGVCIGGTGTDNCDDGSPCTVNGCIAGSCTYLPHINATCESGAKSLLLMSDKADVADLIKWKLIGGPEITQSDLGTPATTTAYWACIFDTTMGFPSLEAQLDFGPSASWIDRDPKGLLYKDPTASLDGVTKALIKTGVAGKSKILVIAKGLNIPMPAPFSMTEYMSQDPRVVIQLYNTATAECWDSEFTTAKKNGATKFKAKTP